MISKDLQIEDWVRLVFGKAKFFCIDNKFPTLDIWRSLDNEFGIDKYNIYVEKQRETITIENSKDNVLLIGNVDYTVICDKLRPYRIMGMHGAKITIKGSNRAVVLIEDDGSCTIKEELTGGAIIVYK